MIICMRAVRELKPQVRRAIKLVGSYGGKARLDMPNILRLAELGTVDVSKSITRRYKLEQADEAYKALARNEINGRAIIDMDL
jgi:succinate semialdehyde reductase (NADPH)